MSDNPATELERLMQELFETVSSRECERYTYDGLRYKPPETYLKDSPLGTICWYMKINLNGYTPTISARTPEECVRKVIEKFKEYEKSNPSNVPETNKNRPKIDATYASEDVRERMAKLLKVSRQRIFVSEREIELVFEWLGEHEDYRFGITLDTIDLAIKEVFGDRLPFYKLQTNYFVTLSSKQSPTAIHIPLFAEAIEIAYKIYGNVEKDSEELSINKAADYIGWLDADELVLEELRPLLLSNDD